jgi:hypothetical protein
LKTNIFIPETIKIGFQDREGTYTGKLAYVIYYDQKGKLRKERSWESWRDKKIPALDFKNEPTAGFVLNKKVGDYVSDWSHRQAYVRVYDPRDFEFEITIENLLYILENASSIKGKGLEGEFIYGWDGKDIILIPVESPDYKEIASFNEIIHSKNYIKGKDLIIGATYRTKNNEEFIYMGRFDYWNTKCTGYDELRHRYEYEDINKGKHYFFYDISRNYRCFRPFKSTGDRIIEVISEQCVENYADIFDRLERDASYSPIDKSKDEYIRYTFEEFSDMVKDDYWNYCYDKYKREVSIYNRDKSCENFSYEERHRSCFTPDIKTGALLETYNTIQPAYKNEYLKNGKLYRTNGRLYREE